MAQCRLLRRGEQPEQDTERDVDAAHQRCSVGKELFVRVQVEGIADVPLRLDLSAPRCREYK